MLQGEERDIENIRLFNNAGLVTVFRLKELLEIATATQNVELAAYLVEAIQKKSGSKSKSLKM
ncbi:MAG: hypothetical protein LBC41_03920 [Clostridiales bacterium]|nr:hypothetical protein [Clostridiales bacterium]